MAMDSSSTHENCVLDYSLELPVLHFVHQILPHLGIFVVFVVIIVILMCHF